MAVVAFIAQVPSKASGEESTARELSRALAAAASSGMAYLDRRFDDLDPMLARAMAPLLSAWIAQSRKAALAHGVETIPAEVRSALAGYVPAAILERVRWCVDCGGSLALQDSAFRTGLTPAITLGDVIVFQASEDALDPKLWVHELKHVMQYAEWGVEGFALRYLSDYAAVEKEAAEFRWQWMKRTGRVPEPVRNP